MISLAPGTAAVATRSETLFTGSSMELDLARKARVSNSTIKEINTPWLLSTVLIVIELEIKTKENERVNEKKDNKMKRAIVEII